MNSKICRPASLCVLLVLLYAAGVAQAQILSLSDAVTKAVTNYPQLQQRQSEVAAGKAHVTTVNGNRLPSLLLQEQLDLGTNNSLQGEYFTMGIVPSTPGNNNSPVQNNNPNPANLAISFLQWQFFNFGYYNAQSREAKAQLAVNEANLGSDKYLLTGRVVFLYLDWLKKYRLLQIQEQNVNRANVLLTAIRATVNSGLKPGVDSSTASATYADARMAYLQAVDDYNYDKITLASYTGLNAGNTVPDTMLVSNALLQEPQSVIIGDSVPESHPLLDVFEKQYEQQLAENNATGKQYLPHLALNGAAWLRNSGISYDGNYPQSVSDGFPYSKYNYLVALTFTYNLFDLKHRHDRLIEGRYQAQARQSALQTQQVQLNNMMQLANNNYATTQQKLREIPVQQQSAQQAFDQQMALYRSGLNTLIEVTNAQYALLQAETNYVNTQSDLLQLLYIRAALSGRSDSFLQNIKP